MYRVWNKKQTIYNCINLYKQKSVAPKLLGCRVNMTYFVKICERLMNYFENKGQISWKHLFECECDGFNSYFFGMES